MLSDILAEFLRDTRKQLGLSREQLARRAKVSTRLLAELERGERPNVSLESALKLLGLLGVSIVARAPDGATAEIRNARTIALERGARAALRRRTWTGEHVHFHRAGEAPSAGRSPAERLSAVSQLSKQAFALAAVGEHSREDREGNKVRVLGHADLRVNKSATGRRKDRDDARELAPRKRRKNRRAK